MPGQGLYDQPTELIDLTSDTENAPSASQIVDLNSLGDIGSPSNDSLDSNLDVNGSTPSLTSSYSQKEGSVVSPDTQKDDGDNSTDDGLTLRSILAQNRKRMLDSDKTTRSWPAKDKSSISQTQEAFQTFSRSHPLKPNSNYWTIYQPVSSQPTLTLRQPMHGPKDENNELGVHPNKKSVDLPLTTASDKAFGCNDEDKNGNKTAFQRNVIKGHVSERTSLDDILSASRDHTNRETEPAKTSDTAVGLEQHARKKPRLENPKDATLDDVPHTSTNDDDGTLLLQSPELGTPELARSLVGKAALAREIATTVLAGEVPGLTHMMTEHRLHPLSIPKGGDLGNLLRPPNRPQHRVDHGLHAQRPLRESVETIEDQWGTNQQRRQPSPMEDNRHKLAHPEVTAEQQKTHRENDSGASTYALARQDLDDIFDADIPAGPSSTTLDVQRAHEGHNETQPGTREPKIVGDSMVRQLSECHARKYQQQLQPQRPWPQSKPQAKPSTIKLPTTNPTRPEPIQPPYATRNETFADAAASFGLLQSKYEKSRTTTILDSVPAEFGLPSRESRMRAAYKANNSGRNPRRRAKEAERKRIRHRELALARKREELEKQYAHETEANRENLISAELAKCRRKYAENDRRREAQAPSYLTVDFLEDGVGADDDAEVNLDEGGSDQRRGAAIRTEGLIPASQALEPNERIVTYAVYISEPYDQDEGYENHMQRTAEAFLIKDEANAFAQKLLTDSSQGWPGVRYDADANGLLVGHKRLPNGKIVSCMVQREMQVFGLLDTRNKWVKEEVKDLYRPRFDVFYTNVVPKVFLEREEEDKQKKKDQKAKEVAAEAEAAEKPEAGEEKEDARGREESPIQGLVEVLDSVEGVEGGEEDRDSLFSSSPTPEPENAQEADNKHSSQSGGNINKDDDGGGSDNVDVDNDNDDNDTASIASDVTLKPDKPGGALGALSWTDVEFQTIHAGSYTDLRLANLAAFKVARLVWQPRTARHYAWEHYDYAVVPSIREGMKEWDLDADRAEIEFEVPEVDGLVDHRPWLFVHSRVFVVEARLEGPRDIGCDFVVVHGEDE
ncbi:hypothetical protein VPNG_03919 [Cytospora leucostoma]|uniref:Uncharacterized protein n=1 Tax=Cytospora leucostoma TaxID=1230097 RepID=A0A423XEA9_9PEZI|nr:hypothetical protein VPNG_03919 [Cytospora leucostoma]